MKKTVLAISLLLATSMVAGCGKEATTTTTQGQVLSEPEYKTETEVVHVTDGMMPQVIEKNTTYVQKEKDGAWEVDSYEITNWNWEEDFIIVDTTWVVETDDVTSIYSELDESFAGMPAKVTMYIYNELWGLDSAITKDANGVPILNVNLHMYADFVMECGGETTYFEGVEITNCKIYEDGTTFLTLKDNGVLEVTSNMNVKQANYEDFLAALSPEDAIRAASVTYISKIDFADLPSFQVTSPNVENGYWDPKITDTKYGENISPELSWDAVDGATNYVVIMIDGDWLHMDVFTEDTFLAEGAYGKSTTNGEQFVGPYPPSNTHTYSVFVFALKGEAASPVLHFNQGSNSINKIYESLETDKDGNTGNVIAYGRLDGNYTHKD